MSSAANESGGARGPRRHLRSVVAVAVVLGALGYLVSGGMEKDLVYFLTPKELLAKGPSVYGAPVRLGGQVVPGSVDWNAQTLDLHFRLTDGAGAVVAVRSKGAPPQMFREGMGIVVEGRYSRDNVFQSSSLMVKHSNEYRAPAPGHTPSEVYKTLIEGSKKS
jgi:cytochrome c-type biogenesis protein CcmE